MLTEICAKKNAIHLSERHFIRNTILILIKNNDYFFFFTALAFGKSVIEPSKISAAKPIDSFNVG